MKPSFQIKWEHFVIVVLLIFLLIEGCGRDPKAVAEPLPVVETVVTKSVDTFRNPIIKNQEPLRIPILETRTEIIRVADPRTLPVEQQQDVKKVNVYRDTISRNGLTLFGEILSEGRILEHNITAEVDHTTTIITKTKIKHAGGLYFSPAIGFSPVTGVESVESGLTYIRRNWGLGAGVYYDFRGNNAGFKITVHKKLF